MEVLLICGTGAIGTALTDSLLEAGHKVFVTTRQNIKSEYRNLRYLQGNYNDAAFLGFVLGYKHWGAIVDFGHYSTEELKRWIPILLLSTDHYIYVSSSRVYEDGGSKRITENHIRQYDMHASEIPSFGAAYVKAQGENIVRESRSDNYTIVRPYITYNVNRLQMGGYEMDWWLQRLIAGKPLIIPRDILGHWTTLTYAGDVGKRIAGILGKEKAKREVFQIASDESHTWQGVLDIYIELLAERGFKPEVYVTDDSSYVDVYFDKDQYEHDRLYERIFDSRKIDEVSGCSDYMRLRNGLVKCLDEFMFRGITFRGNPDYIKWGIYIDKRLRWGEGTLYRPGCKLTFDKVPRKEKIICFGAGRMLRQNIDYIRLNYDILGIVDNDKKMWGQSIDGIRVSAPSMVSRNKEALYVITVDNVKDAFLMMNQVMNYGAIKVEHLRNMIK